MKNPLHEILAECREVTSIPYYAYGDNESAVQMANALQAIKSHAFVLLNEEKERLEQQDTLSSKLERLAEEYPDLSLEKESDSGMWSAISWGDCGPTAEGKSPEQAVDNLIEKLEAGMSKEKDRFKSGEIVEVKNFVGWIAATYLNYIEEFEGEIIKKHIVRVPGYLGERSRFPPHLIRKYQVPDGYVLSEGEIVIVHPNIQGL